MNQITEGSVVTMASILEALEGVLSEEEKQALLTGLIDVRSSGVAPGDLITAELFNEILSDINSLKVRVAALEGAEGAPVIDRIEPQFIDKPLGSLINIFGSGLRGDATDTTVFFNSVPVSLFLTQSNENLIALPIPLSLTGLPRTIQVRVVNGNGESNSVGIRVVEPVVEPDGSIFIRNEGDPLGEIEVGQSYELNWRVVNQLNVERVFTFQSVISDVVGSTVTAWRNRVEISGDLDEPFSSGEGRDIIMKVTVPNNAESVRLGLFVATEDGAFSETSSLTSLVVGEEPEISDSRADIRMRAFFPNSVLGFFTTNVEGADVDGFTIAPDQSLTLPLEISVTAEGGGRYEFETRIEGETGRWDTPRVDTVLQLPNGGTLPIDIPIRGSAATDTTTVSTLVVTARHFSGSSTTSDFASFVSIPIRGQ